MYASLTGKLDVAKLLIASGTDINAKGNDGLTGLMLASMEGQLDVVKFLVSKGADVKAKRNDGISPKTAPPASRAGILPTIAVN